MRKRNKIFRNHIILLMLFASSLLMTACGQKEKAPTPEELLTTYVKRTTFRHGKVVLFYSIPIFISLLQSIAG